MDAVSPQLEHPEGTENTFSYAGNISPGWHRAGAASRPSLSSLQPNPDSVNGSWGGLSAPNLLPCLAWAAAHSP